MNSPLQATLPSDPTRPSAGQRALDPQRVALAHHWLVGMRGGERVLAELAGMLPGRPIYTLVKDESKLGDAFKEHAIHASPLQWVPGAARRYKAMLPLFPAAIDRMRIPIGSELLLSSDAAVIKGIRKPTGCVHVCYCHSPPRYLWEMADVYMQHTSGMNRWKRAAFAALAPRVREYDRRSAERVDRFIANSRFVAQRIRDCYGRDSTVVYPPVAVDAFRHDGPREDFYLVVAQLVSYKRIDLAVDACSQTGRRLIVIGAGEEHQALCRRAGDTVTLMGAQPWEVVRRHFERCRAFLMPGVEDFGITPVEAQAAGAPVVALGLGGVLETVIDGQTGVLYGSQTVDGLIEALERFESLGSSLTPSACRANAERFRPEVFRQGIRGVLAECFADVAQATSP